MPVKVDSQNNNANNTRNSQGINVDYALPFEKKGLARKPLIANVPLCSKIA